MALIAAAHALHTEGAVVPPRRSTPTGKREHAGTRRESENHAQANAKTKSRVEDKEVNLPPSVAAQEDKEIERMSDAGGFGHGNLKISYDETVERDERVELNFLEILSQVAEAVADTDAIFEVKENEMLPLREATGGKFDDIFVKATRRAKTEMMVIYARPQIFMFAPGAERQDAKDYALDLIDGGLNEAKVETLVQRDDTEHNLKQIARQLYWKVTSRDVWKLRGPRVRTVDILDDQ